eukprot:TRINITY_DN3675_c0_g1_i3.p1 TRINITY_DN3675_c0_g1~~TRINITY_DN3675_c0_g1_i3.p1  ORF type:complete len:108 (-),score=10.75 TRINITY_DN3675_c0_g1_i3:466-789(-)
MFQTFPCIIAYRYIIIFQSTFKSLSISLACVNPMSSSASTSTGSGLLLTNPSLPSATLSPKMMGQGCPVRQAVALILNGFRVCRQILLLDFRFGSGHFSNIIPNRIR